MAISWEKGTGLAMRIAVFFFVAVGVGLIVCGCILQNPPKDYAPAMFVAAGSINLFASLAGFWGSYNKKRVLLVFIIFGGLSVLIQIAFVISLFVSFDRVANAIEPSDPTNPNIQARHDKVAKNLNIARWLMIGFIFFELLTLVLAVLLKWVIKPADTTYRGFDDDANEQRQLALANLGESVAKNKTKERAYDKIRDKMAAKYGALAQTGQDWRAKTKMSFTTT